MRLLAIILTAITLAAGPATKPVKPATTVYELRQQIDAMQSEISDLRAEVNALRSEIAHLSPPTTQPTKDEPSKPRIGMTIDEINKAMGRDGIFVYGDVNGVSQFKWLVTAERGHYVGTTYVSESKTIGTWFVTFEGGKATAVQRGP